MCNHNGTTHERANTRADVHTELYVYIQLDVQKRGDVVVIDHNGSWMGRRNRVANKQKNKKTKKNRDWWVTYDSHVANDATVTVVSEPDVSELRVNESDSVKRAPNSSRGMKAPARNET